MEHDRHTIEIDLALTFLNGGSPPGIDDGVTLDTPDRLIAWLCRLPGPSGLTGGLEVSVPLPARQIALKEAQRLRRAMTELFRAVSTGVEVGPTTTHVINRAQSFGRWSSQLVAEGAALRIERSLEGHGPLDALAAVAAAGGMVASVVPAGRLKMCASPACARWFVDSSKGGRRRWCSMATCGNRAKAARYRARHTES